MAEHVCIISILREIPKTQQDFKQQCLTTLISKLSGHGPMWNGTHFYDCHLQSTGQVYIPI